MNNKLIKSSFLDRLGIALSGICIVHCLITPIALTVLPIFTLSSFVEDILFHQLMLWLVLPTSALALFIGCRKHRNLNIAASGILGMRKTGSVEGSSPISPTVRRSNPKISVTEVSAMMQMSGDGITFVTNGNR